MTRSEILSEQQNAARRVREAVGELIHKLCCIYPPFPDYLPGGALDELIHDLRFWTELADDQLEEAWRDQAAEAQDPEADEADFRNALRAEGVV